MQNICPEYLKNYWVYCYFPAAERIDRKRFMPADEIFRLFSSIGFETSIKISSLLEKLDCEKILNEALNRDMSQLNLITEKQYQAGIRRMEKDMATHTIRIADFALPECRCTKK